MRRNGVVHNKCVLMSATSFVPRIYTAFVDCCSAEEGEGIKMACLHDHSCEDHDCSSNWSLYKHIDLPKVSALNEAVPGSVKSVFKAWERRLESSGERLESNEGDPELLIYIP